jgi:hypothetical protein
MSTMHKPTDDIVYDVVSIQYHALKAGEAYSKYLEDVHDHKDVEDFIRQCQEEDKARTLRSHELLRDLMRGHYEEED